MVRSARINDRPHIEVFADFDEFAVAAVATQQNRQVELRSQRRPITRLWPLVGDLTRMHIFPAKPRSLSIAEDVDGFDAFPRRVASPGYGACRQLPDLIVPAERFTSGHDRPLAVGNEEIDHTLDIVGRHCVRDRTGEVRIARRSGDGQRTRSRNHVTSPFLLKTSSSQSNSI